MTTILPALAGGLVAAPPPEQLEDLRFHLADDLQPLPAGQPPQEHPVDRVEPRVDQRLQQFRDLN